MITFVELEIVQRERLSFKILGLKGWSFRCLHRKLSCVFEKDHACLLHPDAVPFDQEYCRRYAKTPHDPEENAPLRRELLPLQKQDKLLYFYTPEQRRLTPVHSEIVVLPSRQWFRARLERFCSPAECGTQRDSSKDYHKKKTPAGAKGYDFRMHNSSLRRPKEGRGAKSPGPIDLRDQRWPFDFRRRSGFGKSKAKVQPLPTIGSLMDYSSKESQKTLQGGLK